MQRIFAGLILIVLLMVVGCAAPLTADTAPMTVADIDKPTAVSEAVAESEKPEAEEATLPEVADTVEVAAETAVDKTEAADEAEADSSVEAGDVEETEAALAQAPTAPVPATNPTAGTNQTIVRADLPVSLVALEDPLRAPVDIVPIPDGSNRNLLVDRVGLVYFLNPSGRIPTEPFMDMRPLLDQNPAGLDGYGLQGLAFDPDFAENGRFYILYSQPQADGTGYDGYLAALNTRPRNLDAADLNTEEILAEYGLDQPQGQLLLENDLLHVTWRSDDAAGQCVDLAQFAAQPCPEPVNELPPRLSTLMTANGTEATTLIPGYTYQGVALPTFLDHYIFAGQDGENGRLFAAVANNEGEQPWAVQDLQIANGENGRFAATFYTISRDAFGEVYLLTAPEEGVNGQIYKLQPDIRLERSLIDGVPEDYMPINVRYARIVRATPIYPNLDAVRAGQANGTFGGGSYWVTIRNEEEVNGKPYYYVHWGWGSYAWMSGDDMLIGALTSSLKGFDLAKYDGGYPVAMAHRPVFVRAIPGPILDETIVGYLDPYDVVNVYETRDYITEEGDSETWYLIGVDQWVHSEFVRFFVTSPRPEGVGPQDKWVEIRLPEQTVIAYEGDTPVLATLSSTGRRGLETEPGLFQVWSTLRDGPMEWDKATPPYSLANIPYIMYFNGDQALHNAYWHDQFGIVRSAGCVNLSPHDAHWLYHWAFPDRPSSRIHNVDENDPILWVWVHDQPVSIDEQLALSHLSPQSLEETDWPPTFIPR
jgi:hypothetical protein